MPIYTVTLEERRSCPSGCPLLPRHGIYIIPSPCTVAIMAIHSRNTTVPVTTQVITAAITPGIITNVSMDTMITTAITVVITAT